MIIRIRTKLIFFITTLIVVLLSSAAFLLTNEKRVELSKDMYLKNLSFVRLISNSIAQNYDTYLKEENFLYFNTEIKNIFGQNSDINRIQVLSYAGEVLYDSSMDIDKKYSGTPRISPDDNLKTQVKSEKISLKILDGIIYFLIFSIDNQVGYVDVFDNPMLAFSDSDFVEYYVVPASDKYSVVFYSNYSQLSSRVNYLINRIVYLTVFGIMLGIILAFLLASHINRPIQKLLKATENVATGNYDSRVEIKTHDELSLLGMGFNKMARDLKASIEARVYKERLGRELELAEQIQNQLIPKRIPIITGVDISAALLPAEEIGGDMYDFLPASNGNHLFYLGDVTGHGIPASLLSSVSSALFYGFAKIGDLKEIIVEVNSVFYAKTMSNMFMTLCLMNFNDLLNKFSYVSAGHEQVVHYKSGEDSAIFMPAGGVALGMTKDISKHIKEISFTMETGDFAVIYSDGIPEMWNTKRELYGMQRLVAVIKANGSAKTAKEMQDAILRDVQLFANGYKQMDDVTIIVLKKN